MWDPTRDHSQPDRPGGPLTQQHLRTGTSDRQRVVDELQHHYVEGRLTSEELSDRVERALQSRTFGELNELLHDLPQPPPAPAESRGRLGHDFPWRTSFAAILIAAGILFLLFMTAGSFWSMGMHGGPWPVWLLFFFIAPGIWGGRHRRH